MRDKDSNLTYRQILKVVSPMLIANLSVPLLGFVDTAILGHLENAVYLGAAALGAQIITTLFWSFGFLRMGTTGFTSRAFGEKSNDKLNSALQQPLVLACLLSALILVTQWLSLPFIVSLTVGVIDSTGHTVENLNLSQLVLEYTKIRIYAAPATLGTYVLIGWLIGVQRVAYAMYILVITNLANIALDYLFILEIGMNANGAALASVLAEYLGFSIALLFVAKELRSSIGLKMGAKLFDISTYTEMLSSSQHLFIRTLCLLFVFLFFTCQAARIGENTLASNAILLSLLSLTAYFMDGFAYSAETLCGEAWGKRNTRIFFETCIKTTILALVIAICSSLILFSGEKWIIQIYTDIPGVVHTAQDNLHWLAIMPLIAIWCYQFDGIFIGVGKTRAMRNNMLMATFFVYLPCWYFTRHLDNEGLWVAFIAFFVARAVSMSMSFNVLYREIKNTEITSTKNLNIS